MGSWKDHYRSWTNTNNLLLLKYEDLIFDPLKEIKKIISFLEKLLNFDYNDQKIENIINSTSFSALQNMETKIGFNEAVLDETSKNKVKFFKDF